MNLELRYCLEIYDIDSRLLNTPIFSLQVACGYYNSIILLYIYIYIYIMYIVYY